MTSQLVILELFSFCRLPDPKSQTESRESTNKKI